MVRWKGTLLIFEVIVAQKCTSQLLLLTSDSLMSTNVTPSKHGGPYSYLLKHVLNECLTVSKETKTLLNF